MHSSHQMDSFHSRIARIQDPRNTHVVDPESGIKIPRRLTRDQIGKQPGASVKMLAMGFVLGLLCLMIARYLRMEVISVEPYFPNGMMTELAMAALGAFVIGGFVKMRSLRTTVAQFAGVAICAATMHNAVWLAPDQFALIFSQTYVDRILAMTEPMSVYVNGMSFALII